MPVDLNDGLAAHRQGLHEQAAAIYEAALQEEPGRHEALYLLGVVSLQRGNLAQARALIGKAVDARRDQPDYHGALAEVLRALGELDSAAASCREALRLRPDDPLNACNLGAILAGQGDLDGAIAQFRRALALQPEFVAAHNNLARALRLQGESAAAVAHLRTVVRLDPACEEAHSALCEILLDQGDAAEARIHGQEVVRLRPNAAPAQIQLGYVLLALGRLEDAESHFRAAMEAGAGLAEAYAGIAEIQEQRGDLDRSIASLRAALAHDPQHAPALAQMATQLRGELPAAERAAIERLAADPGLAPARRGAVLFGLAHVCDALGEFDRAAALAAEANALQSAQLRGRGRSYDPRRIDAFIDQVIDAFQPAFFKHVAGMGLSTERPVFVVGLPRSGTTLVEQILASHPRVFGAGELNLASQAFKAIPEATDHDGALADCLARLTAEGVQRLAHPILEGLAAENASADRIVDKMPENYAHLGLLAALFPRARFIHCRRDIRDTALSCWLTDFGHVDWACDQDHIAARVAGYRRLIAHWRRVLPVPILEVDYEAVVADLEPNARALIAWCRLEWDPACLEFHRTRRPVRTRSMAQVRRPIYGSSVGRWKHYERPLAPFFAKLDRPS